MLHWRKITIWFDVKLEAFPLGFVKKAFGYFFQFFFNFHPTSNLVERTNRLRKQTLNNPDLKSRASFGCQGERGYGRHPITAILPAMPITHQRLHEHYAPRSVIAKINLLHPQNKQSCGGSPFFITHTFEAEGTLDWGAVAPCGRTRSTSSHFSASCRRRSAARRRHISTLMDARQYLGGGDCRYRLFGIV